VIDPAKWLKRLGATIGVVAALAGGWAGYLRLSGNFHPVDEGVIYRSGQLSGAQFASRIQEKHIRTIINLRGNNSGRPWYDDEMKASAAAGVQHINFPISAGRELTDDQVSKLAVFLKESPRPILIHCEGGADRSGLASALYKLLVKKRSPGEASAQLSFRYGHFPWLGSRTVAMDRTFKRIVSQTLLEQSAN
jgi:protein tyrosine/serine phosphatase